MLGLRVDITSMGDKVLTMRSNFGGRCSPDVYIDGHHMRDLTADEVDSWVNPDEVAGIEIYVGAAVPAQFNRGLYQTCGSIVIWTKPAPRPRYHYSMKSRLLMLLGAAALAIGVSAFLDRR